MHQLILQLQYSVGLNKACMFSSDMILCVDVQIQGGWFKGSKALRSLKLEGNLLTSLDSGSFPLNDLKYLESLDLSDNLIDHLGRNRLVHISILLYTFLCLILCSFFILYCVQFPTTYIFLHFQNVIYFFLSNN